MECLNSGSLMYLSSIRLRLVLKEYSDIHLRNSLELNIR